MPPTRAFDLFDNNWQYPIKLITGEGESYYSPTGYVDEAVAEIDLVGHFAPFYRVEEQSGIVSDRHMGVREEGEMSFFTYHVGILEGDTIVSFNDDAGLSKTHYRVVSVKRHHNLMAKYLGQDPRFELYLREKVDT